MSNKKHDARVRARNEKDRQKNTELRKEAAAALEMSKFQKYFNLVVFQRDVARILGLLFFLGDVVLAILLWRVNNGY